MRERGRSRTVGATWSRLHLEGDLQAVGVSGQFRAHLVEERFGFEALDVGNGVQVGVLHHHREFALLVVPLLEGGVGVGDGAIDDAHQVGLRRFGQVGRESLVELAQTQELRAFGEERAKFGLQAREFGGRGIGFPMRVPDARFEPHGG